MSEFIHNNKIRQKTKVQILNGLYLRRACCWSGHSWSCHTRRTFRCISPLGFLFSCTHMFHRYILHCCCICLSRYPCGSLHPDRLSGTHLGCTHIICLTGLHYTWYKRWHWFRNSHIICICIWDWQPLKPAYSTLQSAMPAATLRTVWDSIFTTLTFTDKVKDDLHLLAEAQRVDPYSLWFIFRWTALSCDFYIKHHLWGTTHCCKC